MALWRLILLFLLHTLSNHACAISLSPELTNFVPACAQECFVSFLESNFPITSCSKTPSLECLCSHNTTSGYTVGEGAVQCIISEDNIGFCKGPDAGEAVVLDAYSMCNGQTNALPNTHGTITATLIIQTSMPSVVLIAPNPTFTGSGASATVRSSATLAPSRTGLSSTISTTDTRSTPAASDTAALSPSLSKTQIVAISVASVGGTALALGMLLLFACLRRRKRAARDSDMLPFQLDPSNGTKYSLDYKSSSGRKELKPGGTPNGVAARVPPQVPPRLETSTPNMFSRRSIVPDTIGLAISPEISAAVELIRHPSKLLPEKPALTLKTTQQDDRKPLGGPKSVQPSQPSLQMSAISRQSTATQFEEDDESAVTSAKEEKEHRWIQPPSKMQEAFPGDWRPKKPTIIAVPPPAFSKETGDTSWSSGNISKLNTAAIVPEPVIKPLNVARSANSFSQPRRTEEYYRPGQKLQLQVPARPTTTTSSIYSQRGSSVQGSENGRISGAPPRSRRSYKQAGPYDVRESGGSLTSFETNDSILSPQEPEPRTAGTDLSPVVESPTGTSPVSYPRIPGRLSDSAMRMMPPPPQPEFGPAKNIPLWKQAELTAQRQRMGLAPFQSNLDAVADSGADGQFSQRGAPRTMHQRQRSRDYIAPSAVYNSPSSTQLPQPNQIPPRANLTSNNLSLGSGLNQPYSRTSSNISLTSKTSTSTNATGTSSLLAKRRGEQKAAALIGSLQSARGPSDEERKNGKGKSGWRVLKEEEKERARSPLWRPMLVTGEKGGGGGENGTVSGNGKGNGNGNGKSREARDQRTFFEQTELPRTPGWIPKLTPTRRGDELFLSVG